MTGYEVKRKVDEDMGYFWHVTAPQIYAELKNLEKLGWVTRESGPSKRGPSRQYYQLTDSGQEALEGSILSTTGEVEARDDWKSLWWVVSQSGDAERMAQFLGQMIANLEAQLSRVRLMQKSQSDETGPSRWNDHLLSWTISEIENSLEWAEKTLGEIQGVPTSPGRVEKEKPRSVQGQSSRKLDNSTREDYNPFAGLNDPTLL